MENKVKDPLVSIVIPVYNEEGLLFGSIIELIEKMKIFSFPYEIIVSENGSTDDTREIALRLERNYPQVRVFLTEEPNYGKALKKGIINAKGKFVICDEIDILDVDFYKRALDILMSDQADFVIGSKLHESALDKRPLIRHVATITINLLLKILLDFKGTDTHGLKAFNKEKLIKIVEACIVDRDLFASEFVIRAEKNKVRIIEIPVEIIEKRKPSINLIKRVPNVLINLTKLFWIFRIKGNKNETEKNKTL